MLLTITNTRTMTMMLRQRRECCIGLALWALLSLCRPLLSYSLLTTQPNNQQRRVAGWTLSSFSPHSFFGRREHRRTFSLSSASNENDNDNKVENDIPKEWQGEVLRQLKNVIDPDLSNDIVTLGFVQNLQFDIIENKVSFDVELTTPACPVKDQFAADCERLVLELPFVDTVDVTMTAQEITTQQTDTSGMAQVGAVIAVSSCKGGVGKSTTAVNLAFSLQKLGANVGILDADVYGPSLPTMVKPENDIVRFVGRQIAPLQRNGIKLMSFGYVNEGSAVMRGPMVTQLLDQFLSVTNWGSLDYLILDMPPGTGDVQLTLTQRLNITAAVIVTTPQELSFVDVERGIEMFDSVNVPCIAVVENMAYYEVPEPNLDKSSLKASIIKELQQQDGVVINGEVDSVADALVQVVAQEIQSKQSSSDEDNNSNKIPIFGPGHKNRLAQQWGIEHTFSMPLLDKIAANGDAGTPYVLENPDTIQTSIYNELAKSVVTEVAKAKYSSRRPIVTHDKERNVIQVETTTTSTTTTTNADGGSNDDNKNIIEEIPSAELRRGCRCAACVEELTGRQILVASDVLETIQPLKMAPTGNYALSVDWSDGHRSLYPYRQIRSLIQSTKKSETITTSDSTGEASNSSSSSSSREKTMI